MITTSARSARAVHRCVGLMVIIGALAHGGCDQGAPATGSRSPAVLPAVETGPATVPPAAAGQQPPKNQDQVSAPSAPPASVPAAPNTPPSPAAQRAAPTASSGRLRLSAGVALAQSLPDGTSVMISMDYEWIDGGPEAGAEYGWVVELGNGQRMSGAANVSKRRGTVQGILRGIKPDQGPFRGAVFAKRSTGTGPEPISDFVNLAK
jgi:hypothetical protein